MYADDTQIYGTCRPADAASLTARIACCVDDVTRWMCANRLQLNVSKTELIWFSTTRGTCLLPVGSLSLGGHDIYPSRAVRDLGIYLDHNLSMRYHVDRVVARCFSTLRQLRSVRQYVTVDVFKTLVTSLLLTRLDYGNAVLHGLPANQLRRLQSVQNAAARLIFRLRRNAHITDALMSLHWLSIPERVTFKIAVLTYGAIHNVAPSYLTVFTPVSSVPGRRGLRSSDSQRLIVPRTRLSTVGDRAFPVAGAHVWNSLPANIVSAPSINIFRSRLKTFLFKLSYPAVV